MTKEAASNTLDVCRSKQPMAASPAAAGGDGYCSDGQHLRYERRHLPQWTTPAAVSHGTCNMSNDTNYSFLGYSGDDARICSSDDVKICSSDVLLRRSAQPQQYQFIWCHLLCMLQETRQGHSRLNTKESSDQQPSAEGVASTCNLRC